MDSGSMRGQSQWNGQTRWWGAVLCALTLCSRTGATFTKPSLTEAQFKKDNYEYARDAAAAGYGMETLASAPMREECMEARGYTKVQ